MSAIMAKLMALVMSLLYFFGSFGLGSNAPVPIQVTDENGDPVANAAVYYVESDPLRESYTFCLIGTTDENGSVQWENQQYGEQKLLVCLDPAATPIIDAPAYSFTVTISRIRNEPVNLQIQLASETETANELAA